MPTATKPLEVTMTVNERIADAFVSHGVYFQRVKAHEVSELMAWLDSQVFDKVDMLTVNALSRMATVRTPTLRTKAWLGLMGRASRRFGKGYGDAYTRLADRLYDIARAEAKFTINVLGREVPFDFTPKLPTRRQFRRLVAKTPVNGATVREQFRALGEQGFDQYKRALTTGIVNNEPLSDIIKRMRGPGGAFDTARRWTETRAQSAMDHAGNKGRDGAMEGAEPVKRRQWNATFENTCPECASLHGTVYVLGAGPSMPLHPRCKCYYTPVVTGQKPPKTPLVDTWLKKQNNAKQEAMLGKTRAELWRSGRVKSARQFIAKPHRLMRLDELAKVEGIEI